MSISALAVSTHQFSRTEYETMVMAGMFHPEARMELIDGEIFDKMPQGSQHATAIYLVSEAL